MKLPNKVDNKKLLKGLNSLGLLWKRGLLPDDLERHYMLYWFLRCHGNILETARTLKIHRNTIQGYFLRFKYANKAVKLRHAWQSLNDRFPRKSEPDRFRIFYRRFGRIPALTAAENQGLVALWDSGFPMKVLNAHYLLWASRSGKSRSWIESNLDFSNRHQLRIFGQIGKPKTREHFWLSPLKPSRDEWYLPRYRRLSRKRNS